MISNLYRTVRQGELPVRAREGALGYDLGAPFPSTGKCCLFASISLARANNVRPYGIIRAGGKQTVRRVVAPYGIPLLQYQNGETR